MDKKPAMRYGGQVRTRVIVWLKPSVSTAVGKKFLNPFAARCICCMNAKSLSCVQYYCFCIRASLTYHSLGSDAASRRPRKVDSLPEAWTVSLRIREFASSLSSGVSQRVCNGSSGRTKAARMAMANVMAPKRMKNHRQPVMPATPPKPLKMPAAMSPANAVARMLPV